MNGQEIIDFFQNLIDDEIDADFALDLENNAKDLIETDRNWRMLLKEDSSKTFTSGDNYLTAKALPDDFLSDVKLFLGDPSGNSFQEHDPIGFEERRLYKNTQKYYIDHAGGDFYVCGSVSETKNIYLYYIYQTDDIALDTSPVWPAKFHKLIPFLMAELHKSGIDADDINVRQALSHDKQASILWRAMIKWDARLKLRAMNHSTPMRSTREPYRTNIIQR